MSYEQEAIHHKAQAWLEARAASLCPDLLAEVITLVPTIPTTLVGMSFCRACESVLCGACGECHGLEPGTA